MRFFGGGVLSLLLALAAHRLLEGLLFPAGYGVIFLMGSALLLGSATCFISAGESPAPAADSRERAFASFLGRGLEVVRNDPRFRGFLLAQWVGGLVQMAYPFYIVQAKLAGITEQDVALFSACQTVGALLSNALWGWWGDRRGKLSLLCGVALLGGLAPALMLAWPLANAGVAAPLYWFGGVFVVIGAVINGWIIAQLGFLMEISPDDRRPAYSGYFNVLVAPAALLPIAGAQIAAAVSYRAVFALSLGAALVQFAILRRIGMENPEEG